MYEVIGTRGSRTFRVLWMLEELGVDYRHIPAKPQSPEVRAINPTGKIPALRNGEDVMTDSVAIMTYLADKHGRLTHPAGTPARAQQDALTLRINEELDALLWTEGKQRYFIPEEKRVPGLTAFLHWEYGQYIERFEDLMVGPFLMGDEIRLPDILLAHCLRWAELFGFPAPGPKLTDFKARMEDRPAFAKAMSAD